MKLIKIINSYEEDWYLCKYFECYCIWIFWFGIYFVPVLHFLSLPSTQFWSLYKVKIFVRALLTVNLTDRRFRAYAKNSKSFFHLRLQNFRWALPSHNGQFKWEKKPFWNRNILIITGTLYSLTKHRYRCLLANIIVIIHIINLNLLLRYHSLLSSLHTNNDTIIYHFHLF